MSNIKTFDVQEFSSRPFSMPKPVPKSMTKPGTIHFSTTYRHVSLGLLSPIDYLTPSTTVLTAHHQRMQYELQDASISIPVLVPLPTFYTCFDLQHAIKQL